jgi:hypothetical protein
VSLREQINQRSVVFGGITGVVVLLLIALVFWELFGGRQPARVSTEKVYYTTDDGRTWFADDSRNVPPCEHDGAMAVRCMVFKCSSSAPFAGYLEELTPQAHDEMMASAQHSSMLPFGGILVKKPGAKNWVLSYTPEGAKIINDVHCPAGSGERPQSVLP